MWRRIICPKAYIFLNNRWFERCPISWELSQLFAMISNKTVSWIAQTKAHITFCTINTPSSSFTKSILVLLFAKSWWLSNIIISNVGDRYRCWPLLSFKWQITIRFLFWRTANSSLNGTRFCQAQLWLLWYFQLIAMTVINEPCIYFSSIYTVKQNLQIPSFSFYWCSVKSTPPIDLLYCSTNVGQSISMNCIFWRSHRLILLTESGLQ